MSIPCASHRVSHTDLVAALDRRFVKFVPMEPSGYEDTRLERQVLSSLISPGWSGYRTAEATCPINANQALGRLHDSCHTAVAQHVLPVEA